MEVNMEQLSQDLRGIVGEDFVFTELAERVVYSETLLPYDLDEGELADVIVQPADAKEISEILKYANKHKIPVTPMGSGTGLMFATKPKHKGIMMSTERLTSFEIDEDSQFFEAGAGVKTGQIIKEIGKLGYFLPIQTQLGSSIGGGSEHQHHWALD